MLSADTDDDPRATETASVVEAAWSRLNGRIEDRLNQLELLVSYLFERPLTPDEIERGKELAAQIASTLGVLGLTTSADLIREAADALEAPMLGVQNAVMLASLLEDARVASATAVAEIKAQSGGPEPIVIVGEDCELVDTLVWVTFAQGLGVLRHDGPFGIRSSGTTKVGGVLVVADQIDSSRSRSVMRSVRETYPIEPIVVVAATMRAIDVAALATSVDLVLPATIHPLDMIGELRKSMVRASHERTIALVGTDADRLATLLGERGFIVDSTQDIDELVDAVARGVCRGVIIGGNEGPISDLEILRVLQTDRRTRSTVIVMVSSNLSTARAHQVMRSGADLAVGTSVDIDDLSVSLKSLLARRADREPVAEELSKVGLAPWSAAVVMIERMMMASFRRHQTVSFGVLELPPLKVKDSHIDEMIVSEFRNEDVITRLDDERLVIALQGVSEKIMLRRMQDIHRKYGIGEHGGRGAVVEFPSDGRSLGDLLSTAEELLANAAAGSGPAIVGSAWRIDAGLVTDILIVDPDETLGAVMAATLTRRGIRVEVQPDAMYALDHLTGVSGKPYPRLVILELDLLGLDGLEFLRKVREAGTMGRFEVIVLSSRSREADLRQAFELGAQDYVTKPFSTPLLMHRIDRLLSSS